MSYENIPDDIKRVPNWVVWKSEPLANGKTTKIPVNARTGWNADITNKSQLATFAEAVAATSNQGISGIGFAFTEDAGYGGLDFDDCHTATPERLERYFKIINAFDSYTEYSPSGNGLHSIIKSRIPNGRRRDGIEIYTQGRFFTFTGNVYGMPKHIAERQDLAMQLYNEMGAGADHDRNVTGQERTEFSDVIIERAASASNGDLFKALYRGEWSTCGYSSQSEADQALMNIIVFYTKNRHQAYEIFRSSELGKRDKAKRDSYLGYTFDKAYDQTLPPINFDTLINNINDTIAASKAPKIIERPQQQTGIDIDLWKRERPPGVMGLMVDYFLAQSQLPVYEISLSAALGLMAGICGRSYNINRSGLNLYIMLLAGTGRGKDAMKTGIGSLMSAVSKQELDGQKFESALNFIGPRNAVSGPGLLKHLQKSDTKSYVSLTGEVGKRFKALTDKNASGPDKTFTTALLDLYTAAAHGEMFMGTSYSQEKDSIENIPSPSFTWLGEGEPIGFYETLSDSNISEGLIPRFIIVEYDGPRAEDNDDMNYAKPSPELIGAMTELMRASLGNIQSETVTIPTYADGANELQKHYRSYCRQRMDELEGTPVGQLWNRSHLNILRVSALLAIAHNIHQPVITTKMVEWAASLIVTNSARLTAKFIMGTIGGGDMQKALTKIAKIVVGFFNGGIQPVTGNEVIFLRNATISRSMLSRNTITNHPFKDDKSMLSATIAELIKIGALNMLSVQDKQKKFGESVTAELYQVSDIDWFSKHAVG